VNVIGVSRAPDVEYRFTGDVGDPRAARAALTGWLDDGADVIGGDVVLAAGELVTNVVVHTNGGGVMRVWDPRPDVPLRLEVHDTDMGTPVVAADRAVGGFGLVIVAALADTWGVEWIPTGKIVWAEFDRDRRSSLP
jgi:anti-sigma regulatory factor (Ser/Thr protein kinase)